MSSHREAPAISQDPVADNADTYAFVSPDDPATVTIITNFVPLQGPPGGPNFFEFGDDVLYSIHIDNDGDALDSENWNKRQFYDVSVIRGHGPGMNGKKQHHEQDGKGKKLNHVPLACPPCNIGP